GEIYRKVASGHIRCQLLLHLLFASFLRRVLKVRLRVISPTKLDFGIFDVGAVQAHGDSPIPAVTLTVITDVAEKIIERRIVVNFRERRPEVVRVEKGSASRVACECD